MAPTTPTRTPTRRGLYDPAHEHDACGVGFVADLHGRASRSIVDRGLKILANIDHRGAAGADPDTGDGTGMLLQIPDAFYREVVGFELPAAGHYATGIAFLPTRRMDLLDARREIEDIAREEGAEVLGWREVPVDPRGLGTAAREAMPRFHQPFLVAEGKSGLELDRVMFFVRKRCERELGTKHGENTVYFPSLSARTIVYKGMLTTAARALLPRPRRPPPHLGHRPGALALLHQHIPVVAAGAPLPAGRPQR